MASGQSGHEKRKSSVSATSPQTAQTVLVPRGQDAAGNDDIAEHMTAPNPIVPSPPRRRFQSAPHGVPANRIEQALHRLNDAARRIAAVEPGDGHKPKSARLSPLPGQKLPAIDDGQNNELANGLPDLWPWLQSDSDEMAATGWSNRSDPLLTRRFPDSAATAQIEEEDRRRAAAEGPPSFSQPVPRKRKAASRIRVLFICLALIAVLGLTIDGILASFVFLHKRPVPSIPSGPPTLTLSSNNVRYGENVIVHVHHFSPSSLVFVSRDMQEPVHLAASNATVGPARSMIQANSNGDADVAMYIETTWDPGYHTIEAEDIRSHYTANTSLHIDNAGPTRPPHLAVDDLTIDLGSEMLGANSIRPLRMHNSGSGSITWSASSDQSWLLLSPTKGTFSDSQTISVGGQRANLKPGDYKGKITVSSNVGTSVTVQVIMTVRPLPPNAGPVLQVTPALLSFTATDGGASPDAQYLTVSNPGSRPMHWSISNNAPTANSQGSFLAALGSSINWLSTDSMVGTVEPGATAMVRVRVQSQSLLPGAYINTLMFTADQGTINSPQSVNVSLTVQPQCSLQLNTNILSFTTVQGQSDPNNQVVSLSASPACPSITTWTASSSASWLTMTPGGGQLRGAVSATMGVGVVVAGLAAGTYNGVITVTTAQNTQTVQVQLVVQVPPLPGSPIVTVSPLNVSFSVNQGQPDPPGQVISISNTGGSPLYWHMNFIKSPFGFVAVGLAPTGGKIAPGQTQQAVVNAKTSSAAAGTWSFELQILGSDANNNTAGGNPQRIAVSVNVLPPCALAPPSSGSLAFTATQGGGDPSPQTLSLGASGNCAWPVNWKTSAVPAWLNLSSSSGVFTPNGQNATLAVAPTIAGLSPGIYTAQVSVNATDSANQSLTGSPQSFSVALTVQAPCALQGPSSDLTFSTAQGQSPPAQTVGMSESGACSLPVSWTAASNSAWLVLSPSSGTDGGGGSSTSASIKTDGLAPGTYTGTITLSASGSGGGAVQGSPQTVPVILTVTGFTVAGTVNACADSTCATPVPLAAATVTLTDSTGKAFNATTDASGNYSISNVALGSCTITVSGPTGGTIHYATSSTVTVTGNQTTPVFNAIPS